MSDDTTATQAGDSAEPTPGTPGTPTPRPLTQDDLNRILAAEKRKWQQQAKRDADEAAAAAQGEYKTLAEQRAARIAELEQQSTDAAASLARYQAEVQQQIAARANALPEELRVLQPDGDPLLVYRWLAKAEAAAQKLTAAATTGTPTGARGQRQDTTDISIADLAAAKRRSGVY